MSSISENHGIEAMTSQDQKVYSVGISTGGAAEIRMAQLDPKRHIIATTIDPDGEAFAREQIEKVGLFEQIEIKNEDVAKPLPYPDRYFDFIYARLILHYLSKEDLKMALNELYRILKGGGKLYVVVRSVDCPESSSKSATFDPVTHLTTYFSHGRFYSRYFHSEESIKNSLASSGFLTRYVRSYQEQLYVDFKRAELSSQIDTLIEIVASK